MAHVTAIVDAMITQFIELWQFVDEKFTQLSTMVCSASVRPVVDSATNSLSATSTGFIWSSIAEALRDSMDDDAFELGVDKSVLDGKMSIFSHRRSGLHPK